MKKRVITSAQAPAPIGPYSQGISYGDMVFLSGQIALHPDSGDLIMESLEKETHQVMANIGALLKAEGLDYSNILKSSIFLKDMNDFGKVNEIYGGYFEGTFPARETIEVCTLPKNVNVEISIIAGR